MAPQGAGTPLHITSRVWLKISNLKWVPGTVQSVNDRCAVPEPGAQGASKPPGAGVEHGLCVGVPDLTVRSCI